MSAMALPGQAQPYATDISHWRAQDTLDPPPQNAIVFVGSSSIRRWEELTRDFADYNVIQRGIGGAQFDDLFATVGANSNLNDLVLKYNPRAVVIWAGTNDLASGSGGNEVFADYQQFVTGIRNAGQNPDIFYLGIMPTPGRQSNLPQENIANTQISAMTASDPKLHYIDLPATFATLNPYGGSAFTSKFVDSIHLNRAGYDLWESVIRPQITAVLPPDKVYTPNPATLQVGQSLYFDFGPSDRTNGLPTANPDVNGHYWNNWTGVAGGININAGEHVGNLVNAAGIPTGIDLTITAGFQSNGFQNGGLRNPSAVLLGDFAVDSVTGDYFFSTADGIQGGGDDDMGGGFMLDGLNPNLLYEFQFFGSRNDAQTRITEYRITGANDQSVLLQTSGNNIGVDGAYDGNDDEIAIVSGVQPDQFGQVFIDLTLKQGSFAYISAMKVTAISAIVPEPSAALLALTCVTGLSFIRSRKR
jgi:lysophospholipase L1-like esterase